MNAMRLLTLQAERGAKAAGAESMRKTIDTVTVECRRFIQDRSESYRDLDIDQKKSYIKQLIVDYVMQSMPVVDGYIDEENRTDTNKLVDKLTWEITDYGILSAAMADPTIYEVRGNGKEIKIEQYGKARDYTDVKTGNIITFDSVEQQDIILRKLMGDVRLTPKDAINNARTVEGYRVAAVHSSAISPDPLDPTGDRYHAFVLRKFNKLKLTLDDLVKGESLSDDMARFLALLPESGLTFVTAGATASGKTTLNNAILQATPPGIRVVLMQNPSEIDLRFRDAAGRVTNDVIHIEAREVENPSPTDPTMVNIMNHFLRLSPTIGVFGEFRSNIEFKLAMKIMLAGHPINGTYHAKTSEETIKRFLTAYLAESGNEPSHIALSTLVDCLNIIIIQKQMKDGTRKIMQISEVLGIDDINKDRAVINDLYIFDLEDRADYGPDGTVKKIYGKHKRVGKLSNISIEKFKKEAIDRRRYDFMTKEIDQRYIETYTGENIFTN